MRREESGRTYPARGPADADLSRLEVELLCCRVQRLERWRAGAAPYWRLYWNKNEGASIYARGTRVALGPAHFHLIPPDTPYTTRLDRPVVHLYLHFLTTPGYHNRDGAVHPIEASQELLDAARQVEALLAEGRRHSLRLTALALYLVHAALAHAPEDGFEQTYADARISVTISHMNEHLPDRVSNEHLAGIAHMNPNAYIRLFRQKTGMTPQAYLAKARVARACMLLHHTDRTIDDIASATGFCDRYHLSHIFKRLRGMGPATFRRMREALRA